MFTIKCRHCGEEYYIEGLTKKEWKELNRQNPAVCDSCGEII